MSQQLIRQDDGALNERLIRRYGVTDMRGIESASRSIPTEFFSPEAKRLFMRFFHVLQLNMHYISVFGRMALPERDAAQCEDYMLQLLASTTEAVDEELANSQKLFERSGSTTLGNYHIPPLAVDVLVFSRFGRRYLELICKTDHLMLMLEMLALDEILSITDVLQHKARIKRSVRKVAGQSLTLRARIRRLIREPRAIGEPSAAPVLEHISAGVGGDGAPLLAAPREASGEDDEGVSEQDRTD